LTRDIRVTDPLDNHDKVWRRNLACNIIEKEIFYLDQLLNNNNSELITWQQLKKAWSESAKEKKARWFVEIERQTLVNNTSRLVKDEFRLDKKIQQTVRPPLFKYKKDKRNKDWIIFEDQKSKSCMLGKIEKKKERKLSVEHWVEKKVNNGEYFTIRYKHCALNQREKENNCITKIKVDSVKGCIHSIEIAEMEIELINSLNLEKETKDMLSSM
ncbi:10532_t:CDS:2, partial [Gigaspora margarita]